MKKALYMGAQEWQTLDTAPKSLLVTVSKGKVGLSGTPEHLAHDAMLAHAFDIAREKMGDAEKEKFSNDVKIAFNDIFDGKSSRPMSISEASRRAGVEIGFGETTDETEKLF